MIFSASLVLPASIAYFYSENSILNVFLGCSLVIFLIGISLFIISSDKKEELRTKDGFLITVLFWGVLTIFGSFPIYFSEFKDISYIDSLFESVSGITTTGATILVGIDEMPRSLLFYRQLIQWLGGMGIIVLAVAVLPLLGVGGMQLYKAEIPGPLKEAKLKPRITETAKTLWLIYLTLTIVCALFYRFFGMSTYDAICHAFSTVSIGGFSTHDESFGFFEQTGIRITCMAFMVIAGINFALHYISWHKKRLLHYFYDSEVKTYLFLLLGLFFITTLTLYIYFPSNTSLWAIEEGAFQVISITTTTGFLTANYAIWPLFVPIMLLTASFIGACAGSTGGGIKVIRGLVLLKHGGSEITKLIHPNAVVSIKLGKKVVDNRVVESIWGFLSIYVLVFLLILFLLLSQGNDFLTSFSAVGATLNNMGPGLGSVAENYKGLSDISKLGLCFAMILGRLEIFTLLVLLTPSFWRN
ncbi:MAG: TrkH family potassium uptake protein [Gammaproteobacteria bacterium]